MPIENIEQGTRGYPRDVVDYLRWFETSKGRMTPRESAYSRSALEREVRRSYTRNKPEYIGRLEWLVDHDNGEAGWRHSMVSYYDNESRICWIYGAWVATIVMAQMAFEEFFRSHYRVFPGQGKLSTDKRVNDANYKDLIDAALEDKLITQDEADWLHRLRKEFRNPWVHTKLLSATSAGAREVEGRDTVVARLRAEKSLQCQIMKIFSPDVAEDSVVLDAQFAVTVLITLLPQLESRTVL